MRFARHTTATAPFALSLGFFFACAAGNEEPKAEPNPGSDPTLLDAGAAEATPTDDGGEGSTPSTCSKDGFCYVTLPPLGPLLAVSASSADDAWMVPEHSGAILRWNGTVVKEVYEYEGASPPSITFQGIWAETKDSVWAPALGSDGHIFVVRHASPSGGGAPEFRELQTQEAASAIVALWGTGAGDALWLVTDRAVLRLHEDGAGAVVDNLSPTSDAPDAARYFWRGIWGFAPDDVYVAGSVCFSAACTLDDTQGVIGHYDGASWSITTLATTSQVSSLHGMLAGSDRQLWYDTVEAKPSTAPEKTYIGKTYLVSVTNEGGPGTPIFSHEAADSPACTTQIGHAAPSSGWFSGGLLLCRWTGTSLEPVQTALGSRPIAQQVRGIWAGNADDVWVVGTAVTRDGLPKRGFAARRTAASAQGGQ